jgi:flagellar basal body-associated protein FliL
VSNEAIFWTAVVIVAVIVIAGGSVALGWHLEKAQRASDKRGVAE